MSRLLFGTVILLAMAAGSRSQTTKNDGAGMRPPDLAAMQERSAAGRGFDNSYQLSIYSTKGGKPFSTAVAEYHLREAEPMPTTQTTGVSMLLEIQSFSATSSEGEKHEFAPEKVSVILDDEGLKPATSTNEFSSNALISYLNGIMFFRLGDSRPSWPAGLCDVKSLSTQLIPRTARVVAMGAKQLQLRFVGDAMETPPGQKVPPIAVGTVTLDTLTGFVDDSQLSATVDGGTLQSRFVLHRLKDGGGN